MFTIISHSIEALRDTLMFCKDVVRRSLEPHELFMLDDSKMRLIHIVGAEFFLQCVWFFS